MLGSTIEQISSCTATTTLPSTLYPSRREWKVWGKTRCLRQVMHRVLRHRDPQRLKAILAACNLCIWLKHVTSTSKEMPCLSKQCLEIFLPKPWHWKEMEQSPECRVQEIPGVKNMWALYGTVKAQPSGIATCGKEIIDTFCGVLHPNRPPTIKSLNPTTGDLDQWTNP